MEFREAVARVVSLCAPVSVVPDFYGTVNALRDGAGRCPLNSAHPMHPGNCDLSEWVGQLGLDTAMGYRIARAADSLDDMGRRAPSSPDRDILLAELLVAGKLIGEPAPSPVIERATAALADRETTAP